MNETTTFSCIKKFFMRNHMSVVWFCVLQGANGHPVLQQNCTLMVS